MVHVKLAVDHMQVDQPFHTPYTQLRVALSTKQWWPILPKVDFGICSNTRTARVNVALLLTSPFPALQYPYCESLLVGQS